MHSWIIIVIGIALNWTDSRIVGFSSIFEPLSKSLDGQRYLKIWLQIKNKDEVVLKL